MARAPLYRYEALAGSRKGESDVQSRPELRGSDGRPYGAEAAFRRDLWSRRLGGTVDAASGGANLAPPQARVTQAPTVTVAHRDPSVWPWSRSRFALLVPNASAGRPACCAVWIAAAARFISRCWLSEFAGAPSGVFVVIPYRSR